MGPSPLAESVVENITSWAFERQGRRAEGLTSRKAALLARWSAGEVVSYQTMGVRMDALQAMLLLVIGTGGVLALASIPWRLCREGLTRSLDITRFSVLGALCACFVALAGIAFVGSTALLTVTPLP
jgi:hypothetical protein